MGDPMFQGGALLGLERSTASPGPSRLAEMAAYLRRAADAVEGGMLGDVEAFAVVVRSEAGPGWGAEMCPALRHVVERGVGAPRPLATWRAFPMDS